MFYCMFYFICDRSLSTMPSYIRLKGALHPQSYTCVIMYTVVELEYDNFFINKFWK